MSNDLTLAQGPFPHGEEFRNSVSDIMRHDGINNITMKGMRKRLETIYRIDFTPHKEKLSNLVVEICETPEFKKSIGQIAKQEKDGLVSKGTKKLSSAKKGKKDSEKPSSSKNGSDAKKKKPDNYPKAPLTSYFIFLADVRKKISDENPGMKHVDQTRKAGELYNTLSKEEREQYDVKASDDKVRFQKEMAEYKANGGELFTRSSKSGKKAKTEKDPNRPKAPLTGYFMFMKEARPKAVETLGSSKDIVAVSKQIKILWDAMTPSEKAVLDEKVLEDKERYRRECEEKGYHVNATKPPRKVAPGMKRDRKDSPQRPSSSDSGSSSGSSSSSSSDSD